MQGVDRPDAGQGRRLATLERLLAIRATRLKEALDEASDLVAAAVGADKADAFLLDPATQTLVAVGTSNTPMGREQHRLGLERMPLANGGPTVETFRTGVSYRTGHAEGDPTVPAGITKGLGIRSLADVALEADGGRLGVFEVASAREGAFSTDDLRFLEAVGRWVGMVAQRAALDERLERDATERSRRAAADELIAVLAHDLRTPLTPARGHLELLRRRAEREGRAQDVRHAEQAELALERLGRMIADLLDAGRLEQDLFTLAPRPVDLAEPVRRTADTLHQPEAPILAEIPDDLVIERADPERLRQALENLIGNALKHGPTGVPVVVSLARERGDEGGWAVLRVSGQGPGVAPEVLPALFERFARGPGSAGLGLGLYLARGIAAAHGGTIAVESARGAGSTFTVRLPMGGV